MGETPFHEPFGPVYARPTGAACPDCECCSKALCDTAKAATHWTLQACHHHARYGDYDLVVDCPCPTASASHD